MWMYIGGFALELMLLCALFDIYFRSPIVTGITSEKNPVPGPAKRVVLFVADGLRAESLYSAYQNNTPYLRDIIEKHGTWGVSHTRVPTESRPGIVAIVGGVYEDPSAVFKGWKEYPVEFDTVLNQSRHTWAWGSPDVIHMFSKGHVETFSNDAQDFSSSESWQLDLWVFQSVKSLFTAEKKSAEVENLLHQDQIIFFLHLVGLDTAGHSVKPNSKSYEKNLQVVDTGVKETVDLIESFYNHDGRTAYVFTADHGMTDWGSHGAGSRAETEVPIIAWGKGVQKPRKTELLKTLSPSHWRLGQLMRVDIAQADVTVLLASLIGCSIPVNSMGWIPIQYIDLATQDLSRFAFYNARQLLNQAKRKREELHFDTLSWLYTPFPELTPDQEEMSISNLHSTLKLGDFDSVVWNSKQLADLSIRALRYYHNYYQDALLSAVSLAYLSWIGWLLHAIYVMPRFAKAVPHRYKPWKSYYTTIPFGVIAVIVFLLIQVQHLPWQFNIYCEAPVLLLWTLFRQGHLWSPVLLESSAWSFVSTSVFVVAFSVVMVSAFTHRWVLSIWLLALAGWPLFSARLRNTLPTHLKLFWISSSVILALFPLLPVVGGEPSLIQILLSGLMWLAFGTVLGPLLGGSRFLNTVQLIVLFISIVNTICVTSSRSLGFGLPYICRMTSWAVTGLSLVLPLLSERTVLCRILSLMLGVITPYLLLSVKYEVFFLIALSAHLFFWLLIETYSEQSITKELQSLLYPVPSWRKRFERAFSHEDIRRTIFFVFYIFLSFFGTGNIASLNSFDVTWVRCFVSVFSPFTMATLIIFKTLLPFIIVTTVFRAVTVIVDAPIGNTFISALIIFDLMGLQFLHHVTNEGSWLEIGSSISHYVIVQVTILLLLGIFELVSVLTGLQLPFSTTKSIKTKKNDPSVGSTKRRQMAQGLLPS